MFSFLFFYYRTSQSLSYLDDQAKREILTHNNIQISQPYVLMESFIQGASTSISQVTITMVPETQCGKLWPTGYNTSSLIVTKGLPLSGEYLPFQAHPLSLSYTLPATHLQVPRQDHLASRFSAFAYAVPPA